MQRLLTLTGLSFLLLLFTGCTAMDYPFPMAPVGQLPAFLDDASIRVREAYRFAIANPQELEKYPCYCGCNAMGHRHNLDCYIAGKHANGALKYDEHAQYCQVCIDITHDVMRLMRQGKSSAEIRAYIDATYSAFGPSTTTPMVH